MTTSISAPASFELLSKLFSDVYHRLAESGVELHIILAALFPIYIGAHASLSRPASADKPKKEHEQDDSDDEDDTQIMEGMSPRDAILFPVTAGLVLATLYWLIKKYGADVINLIMAWYLAGTGVFSIAKLFSDFIDLCFDFVFPAYYADRGMLFEVRSTAKQALTVSKDSSDTVRTSPLPGRLGRMSLSQATSSFLWQARAAYKNKFVLKAYIKGLIDEKSVFRTVHAASLIVGVAVVLYSNLVDNLWWLTNIRGFAFSYFALQLISPTSFVVGSLVLSGLFFYDIWAVFFTPLMITVATNLQQPIMLLFPRPTEEPEIPFARPTKPQYSMLGLGDIVLPGLMIALALRFDLYIFYARKQVKTVVDSKTEQIRKAQYTPVRGQWAARFWTMSQSRDSVPVSIRNAAFPKPYFHAGLVGYVLGMIATLVVMLTFRHAQPALLYLVPAVLLSLWGTATARGELRDMWSYTEELTGEAATQKDTTKPTVTQNDKDGPWWTTLMRFWSSEISQTSSVSEEKQAQDVNKVDNERKQEQDQSQCGVSAGTLFLFSVESRVTPQVKSEQDRVLSKT